MYFLSKSANKYFFTTTSKLGMSLQREKPFIACTLRNSFGIIKLHVLHSKIFSWGKFLWIFPGCENSMPVHDELHYLDTCKKFIPQKACLGQIHKNITRQKFAAIRYYFFALFASKILNHEHIQILLVSLNLALSMAWLTVFLNSE